MAVLKLTVKSLVSFVLFPVGAQISSSGLSLLGVELSLEAYGRMVLLVTTLYPLFDLLGIGCCCGVGPVARPVAGWVPVEDMSCCMERATG